MDKYEKAKKIYFRNFASTYFMRRNGELKTYLKAKVPVEVENTWKDYIKKKIIADIKSGENLSLLWNLSHIDISFKELMEIYKDLSKSVNKNAILDYLYKLKQLFVTDNEDLWNQIVALFRC